MLPETRCLKRVTIGSLGQMPETQCLRSAPDGQDRLFIHRLYTMSTQSPRKTSKGPKPNPDNQSRRVLTNQSARDESIKRRLSQQRGREAENELPEEAQFINAASGLERQKRLKSSIHKLLEQRRRTEKNNTRKYGTKRTGTKRKIKPIPPPSSTVIHTDYSTNTERWIEPEPKPEKIQSFREHLVELEGPMKNSKIFNATRNALGKRSRERNEASKSRSQKISKTQSAPGLLEQVENLFGNFLHKVTTFTKLKGT